ncbi:MAG TPA: type I-E CRISPR-associated protein Cas6/Cse3/CasE [Herpetosiphonaceae bacterium]
MLYLSRLMLNVRDRNVRRDLADVQQLHRTILRAFPSVPEGVSAREHFGILFRAEPVTDQPLVVRVLVQSTHTPDWSHLLTGYLAPPADDRPNPAVRQLLDYDHVVAGMTLRFRLRANPTQRIGKGNLEQDVKWRGKRVELRREADQLTWIGRKAEQGGFRLLSIATRPDLADVRISPQAKVVGARSKDPIRKPMTFGAVLFEGLLQVQDRDRFRQTLIAGIGSGKAYGFGLMSIGTSRGGVT